MSSTPFASPAAGAPNAAGSAAARPSAALFDLDGTLVDSLQGIGATIDAVLQGLGRPPCDRGALRRLVGAPLERIFGALLPALSEAECAACADAYRARYWETGVPHTPLFAGVADVLDACSSAGMRLGLVTTKRVDIATHLLAARGIAERFAAVIGGDSTPHHKPHPAPALAALEHLGLTPGDARRVTVVGDTSFDMEMARTAGCRAIGVAWGYGGAESLLAAGAQHVVENAAELRTLLLGGGKRMPG